MYILTNTLYLKSNQYYVSQKRTELSILVREMWKIEKYHWETCVVTGNYFSLRQDRPRAITYFQRYLLYLYSVIIFVFLGHYK